MPKIDPLTEARETLKEVVRMLNKGNEGSRALWLVLTALRGPDDGDLNLKARTTARLRGAIGLRESPGTYIGAHVIKTKREELPEADYGPLGTGHFATHYIMAVRALNELYQKPKKEKKL